MLSHRGGLSHQLRHELSGAGEVLSDRRPQPLVSARSYLRDPILGACRFGRLRSGLPCCRVGKVGFPEFTRLFDHSRLWKLQQITAACSTIELPRNQ